MGFQEVRMARHAVRCRSSSGGVQVGLQEQRSAGTLWAPPCSGPCRGTRALRTSPATHAPAPPCNGPCRGTTALQTFPLPHTQLPTETHTHTHATHTHIHTHVSPVTELHASTEIHTRTHTHTCSHTHTHTHTYTHTHTHTHTHAHTHSRTARRAACRTWRDSAAPRWPRSSSSSSRRAST